MKRRQFITGMILSGVSFLAPIEIPEFKDNYQDFYDSVFNEICKTQEIPREILEMEFSKGYSLSREIILHEFNFLKSSFVPLPTKI